MELDHLFVCASRGAPEAEHLIHLGFVEGPANVHPGQGTANRRFFFENAMLELIWVEDPFEARSKQTAPTKLWERWSGRSDGVVSPFGIVMRPGPDEDVTPPFAVWEYKPDYFPPGMSLHICEAGVDEPMWVFMPSSLRRGIEGPEHPNGIRAITGLTLTSPAPMRSRAAEALPSLRVEHGHAHLLSIEFDHAARGESLDLRPHLPLILRY